ncbi:transcription antitermination factor NusB [Terriglobus roseus]|uniref:16S rRNA (Cytosine967-C5)-methyltransferase n=1 Tax=Terriglobus roseus TaxID=392734 RepID=A0A1G7GFB1_9BACT|nr:transcription antitermination factor NusB [Terriglobus roseus]SDE86828.1 16S rRNA (cytosine967-C5)-methyltransferase [Terriglobus roseus]
MKSQNQPAISPARDAAIQILYRVMSSAAHSDDLLHSPAVNRLSPEDRNLTTALVLGVLRWQSQLDAVMRPMLQRPDAELHPAALLALRLGIFQLLHMDRIPPHAAINESVEMARDNGAPHAAGMVNAILRRVQREKESPKRTPLIVTMTPEEQAHPEWLITRWRKNFGTAATRRIATYDQQEPPSGQLYTPEEGLPQIDDGSRAIAEITAAAVPNPKRILDCCAAPGGKTAVLAIRHPQAEIIACDISPKRLEAMRKRMDRSESTKHVKTLLADMTAPPAELQAGKFDLILCDAPCSGTGTLSRNPEIRHRLRQSDLPRQADRQKAILNQALLLLAPGGRLIYSTCSLEPEENLEVVNAVTTGSHRTIDLTSLLPQSVSAAAIDGTLRTLPGTQPCDGFFAALLETSPAE